LLKTNMERTWKIHVCNPGSMIWQLKISGVWV
jgi:hypothetical protein